MTTEEWNDKPAGGHPMTPTTLAETILRDVPRYRLNGYDAATEPAKQGGIVFLSDVLAALSTALDPSLAERVGKVLEGVTGPKWEVLEEEDGVRIVSPDCDLDEPWYIAKMIDGIGQVPDAANARFIAWCREGVPALLAQNAALRAERDALAAQVAFTATDGQRLLRKGDVEGVCDWIHLCFEGEGQTTRCGPCAAKIAARDGVELNEYTHSNPQAMRLRRELSAAEAEVEKLREAADWQEKHRRDAFTRRHIHAPEDPHVAVLCERYGYGAVMDAASRLWARKDSVGAFYIGGCIGIKPDAALTAALDGVDERAVEVLEGVTPGPWAYRPDRYDDWGIVKEGDCVICQARHPDRIASEVLSEWRAKGQDPWEANARFIAWCREGVPALLAQNAALRAERDRYLRHLTAGAESLNAYKARADAAEAKVEKLRGAGDALAEQASHVALGANITGMDIYESAKNLRPLVEAWVALTTENQANG